MPLLTSLDIEEPVNNESSITIFVFNLNFHLLIFQIVKLVLPHKVIFFLLLTTPSCTDILHQHNFSNENTKIVILQVFKNYS